MRPDGPDGRSRAKSWPLLPVAAAAAAFIFGTPAHLAGPLLYDDKAAILRNPVVVGAVPLARVWAVDFWGENELHHASSHKSWRPLVTLSYRANYAWHGAQPFGYHLVNCILHVCVSALVEPTARAAFGDEYRLAAGLSAILFAVHPVHVEAVQNIVGRAELMMALFYLSGFLCYTRLTSRTSTKRHATTTGATPADSGRSFTWHVRGTHSRSRSYCSTPSLRCCARRLAPRYQPCAWLGMSSCTAACTLGPSLPQPPRRSPRQCCVPTCCRRQHASQRPSAAGARCSCAVPLCPWALPRCACGG